jgi:hypothetical protein
LWRADEDLIIIIIIIIIYIERIVALSLLSPMLPFSANTYSVYLEVMC